jgi:hypothetical protein
MCRIILYNSPKVLNAIADPNKSNKDRLIPSLSRISEALNFVLIQNDLRSSKRIRLLRNKKLKKALSSRTSDTVTVTENEILGSTSVLQQMLPTFQSL